MKPLHIGYPVVSIRPSRDSVWPRDNDVEGLSEGRAALGFFLFEYVWIWRQCFAFPSSLMGLPFNPQVRAQRYKDDAKTFFGSSLGLRTDFVLPSC